MRLSGPRDVERLKAQGAEAKRRGDLEAAEQALRAAATLAPDDARAAVLLGETLLSQGRYAEAWPLMERRLETPELGSSRPPLDEPEWLGGPLSGKRLLIVGEQGAGDQIMYARFAPILQAQGAEVALLCAPRLARLFEASLGVETRAMAGQVEMADPDCWTLSASLPARLRITTTNLPAQPYLSAFPRPLGARIGVMAKGNPRHPNDAHRSLPEDAAARLLEGAGVIDLSPEVTGAADFAETAAIIAGLELVISVDTAVAHLAGAMGKPVWILLPAHGNDWRWMEGRADSPWYPSARLWRQPRPHAWDAVLDALESALA